MAHHVEPMDIDSDFDNKENSLHHNNVLPFTEKGYEELDVSELNMKLRYSVTPASSPMSKSFTTYPDHTCLESGDDSANVTVNENFYLSRSLNSTMTKNDNTVKSLKALPLQSISTDQYADCNRNTSILRPKDSAVTSNNITVTVSGPSDIDENLSLPSSSSSALQTPEATTPTKDIPHKDGPPSSPIMRGLKSVLNMFRSSQSPIPPADNETIVKSEILSPANDMVSTPENKSTAVLASTPISSHRKKEMSPTKRSSPQKDSSIVFNDDLEKELQWKDETTIIFSQERIPIHKLLLQQPQETKNSNKTIELPQQDMQDLNNTVEYMDISYNDSLRDRTMTDIEVSNINADSTYIGESDGEFVDCETTFSKNASQVFEDIDKTPTANQTQDLDVTIDVQSENESGSRLKPIILDTTQDILDATLSVRPEDLLPEALPTTKDMSTLASVTTENIDTSTEMAEPKDIHEISSSSQVNQSIINQVADTTNPITLEAKEEESNVTKPMFDQTLDITNSTILEPKVDSNTTPPILDQTVDITNAHILQEKVADPNITQTIEAMSTTQPINETFDAALIGLISEKNQKENLEITSTFENILDETHILENPTSNSGDLNTTLTSTMVLDNKTFDTVAPVVDNINDKTTDTTTDVEPKTSGPIDFTITADIPVATTLDSTSLEEAINVPLPVSEDFNRISKKETLISELPFDIPLPDEDDLDKDFNDDVHIETTTEVIPKIILPPDLVDNIKEMHEIEIINTVIEVNTVSLIENPKKEDESAEIGVPQNIPKLEDGDNINSQIIEVDSTVAVEENQDNGEPINAENEMSELCKKAENVQMLLEAASPSNVVTDEMVNVMSELCKLTAKVHMLKEVTSPSSVTENKSGIENNEINETNLKMNVIETVDENKIVKNASPSSITKNKSGIENNEINETNLKMNVIETVDENKIVKHIVEHVIENQDVVSMDINESVCELKPLPDIINQTITMPNTLDLDTISAISETVITKEIESNLDHFETTATVIPAVVPGGGYEIEHQLTSANDFERLEPVIETSKVNEEESMITPTEHAVLAQELTNEAVLSNYDNNIAMSVNTDVTEANTTDKIPTETNKSVIENDIPKSEVTDQGIENFNEEIQINLTSKDIKEGISDAKQVEEKIVVSENNSPFVSVIADNISELTPLGNTELETEITTTAPSSPPIRSKGYNFNFDDMDFDPFATKTNIRISPPADSPNKSAEPTTQAKAVDEVVLKKDFNRRKSQPERRRPASKRKFNSTFDGKINDKVIEKNSDKCETDSSGDIQLASPAPIALNPNNVAIEEQNLNEDVSVAPEILNTEPEKALKNNEIEQPITESSESIVDSKSHELKATSSSEQSTYFSAGTSSSEGSVLSKNVFNLPEIDDVNFNPFATKSKMCQSPPPPSVDLDSPLATKGEVTSSLDSYTNVSQKDETKMLEDKIDTEPMEKDTSGNLSNTTDSSKATDDRNVTTREVHTEDEDTVEGPFLEVEDLHPGDKMLDFDGNNDMMQFNELPTQSNEDNVDNGEMFIDAEAFEFLLNQNKSNTIVDSGKESLFLKFDPLFSKRMSAVTSEGVLASLAKLQRRQSTPIKAGQTPPKNMSPPVAGPSNLNVTGDMNISEEYNDDLNITVSKPMMVVPPAVNPVTPRNKSLTPNRSNRRSFTFTSPAMAVIDRLLSLSGNNSLVHDTTVTQVSREQNEADIALSQLRELLAEKEINVYNLRSESNELRDRLNTLECQVKSLESEGQDRLKKINQLNNTLVEKTKINKSMAAVVEEYERTIASLIAETAQDKKRHAEERIRLINERDEQTAHLASMEVSFSDLHSKYEKSKQVILNCKANEDAYKKSIKEFEENLAKMQNNYELLKQHATSKLNHANQELEKINRSHEAEVLKLNAMIKRKELHITSLEESLVQKTKANEELTAICDELINKVG